LDDDVGQGSVEGEIWKMWEIQDVWVDVDGDLFVACGVDNGVWIIG
jgi:hypothetical protein